MCILAAQQDNEANLSNDCKMSEETNGARDVDVSGQVQWDYRSGSADGVDKA